MGICWPVPSEKEVDNREKAGHRARRKGYKKRSTGGSEEQTEEVVGWGGHSRAPQQNDYQIHEVGGTRRGTREREQLGARQGCEP